MRRTELLWIVLTAATAFGTGCSNTERANPPSSGQADEGRAGAVGTGGAGANVRSDEDFVRDVAVKNLAEIELSRLALQKATNPAIKAFAQRMVEEHAAAGNTLKGIVSGRSIEWPAQLDDEHRKAADELAKKHGADFDRDYVKAMVEGHQDLAAKIESRLDVRSLADWKAAAAGRTRSNALPDPDTLRDVQVRPATSDNALTAKINQWAADTYPVAQKHLDAARTLENAGTKRSTD